MRTEEAKQKMQFETGCSKHVVRNLQFEQAIRNLLSLLTAVHFQFEGRSRCRQFELAGGGPAVRNLPAELAVQNMIVGPAVESGLETLAVRTLSVRSLLSEACSSRLVACNLRFQAAVRTCYSKLAV